MSEIGYLSDLLGSLPRALDFSLTTNNHNHSFCSTPNDATSLPPYTLQTLRTRLRGSRKRNPFRARTR
ncbi:hypothetical protein Pmani_021129 [Petrolisthes manimaculis]|uniref:Uncharacterized protein n=1 Tax=Petrolisthes manimaculis TaxID=1843537 RepID=A0AAE1PER5_9EUCA|nr:hypothetical protein Pmani_021129 [Petrolisthes manimaculis]